MGMLGFIQMEGQGSLVVMRMRSVRTMHAEDYETEYAGKRREDVGSCLAAGCRGTRD